MVVTSDRDANGMLPDGSNPEGVDPVPALGWSSQADLKDVVVHGPMFSWGTTKIRQDKCMLNSMCAPLPGGLPPYEEVDMGQQP
jgi:hypothetical protein